MKLIAIFQKKCIFLGYGTSGEMGYYLWETEARRIVRSNDVYFNEEKMHKRPIPTVEIRRVVFQEDGVVHNRDIAHNAGQQGKNAPIVQEGRVEPQAPKA